MGPSSPPLRDAAAHDFRPSTASLPAGRGGPRFRCRGASYETVREWNFLSLRATQNPHPGRGTGAVFLLHGTGRLLQVPTYPLKGVNVTLKDYQNGRWRTGPRARCIFTGNNQYAILRNEDICHSVTLEPEAQERFEPDVSGPDLSNPQITPRTSSSRLTFKTRLGRQMPC